MRIQLALDAQRPGQLRIERHLILILVKQIGKRELQCLGLS